MAVVEHYCRGETREGGGANWGGSLVNGGSASVSMAPTASSEVLSLYYWYPVSTSNPDADHWVTGLGFTYSASNTTNVMYYTTLVLNGANSNTYTGVYTGTGRSWFGLPASVQVVNMFNLRTRISVRFYARNTTNNIQTATVSQWKLLVYYADRHHYPQDSGLVSGQESIPWSTRTLELTDRGDGSLGAEEVAGLVLDRDDNGLIESGEESRIVLNLEDWGDVLEEDGIYRNLFLVDRGLIADCTAVRIDDGIQVRFFLWDCRGSIMGEDAIDSLDRTPPEIRDPFASILLRPYKVSLLIRPRRKR